MFRSFIIEKNNITFECSVCELRESWFVFISIKYRITWNELWSTCMSCVCTVHAYGANDECKQIIFMQLSFAVSKLRCMVGSLLLFEHTAPDNLECFTVCAHLYVWHVWATILLYCIGRSFNYGGTTWNIFKRIWFHNININF